MSRHVDRMLLDVDTYYSNEVTASDLDIFSLVEISLVTEGSGIHRILNQSVPCKKGDIFIIGSSTPHKYFLSESDSCTVLCARFDPDEFFDGELRSRESARYCYGVFKDNPIATYAVLTKQTFDDVIGLLDSIQSESDKQLDEWLDAVKADLTLLLITVSRYVGNAIKHLSPIPPREWSYVTYAVNTVKDTYSDESLTLEAISQQLFISKSYLSKLFKRYTGENFTDYVRSVRLNHACNLLTCTNETVEQIAKLCGLKDLPSFYRVFSNQYGITPGKYRLMNANNIKTEQGEKIMSILEEISTNLQNGKAKIVKELVQQAVDEGASVDLILTDGLLHGMSIIGEKFKNNEVYVPEVLVAARAMNMGMQILKPYLLENGNTTLGKACLGTVQGDLHDIGKNLVKIMLESKGIEVIDLGTDVSPETFVNTAIDEGCDIICCSALLTTTMGVMGDVVKLAEEKGIRDKVKIMIGGAPTNEDFCKKIGADVYTSDAASAADAAANLLKQ